MCILKISNHTKQLILLFFTAFVIRLISLSQSFWLDEATTANVVKDNTFLGIIKNFSPYDFHPPFYYLFLKLWSLLFGYWEVSLRFPSVLLSLAAGYVIYHTGALIKNRSLGLWSAVFFLFNPLIVYYSQEARMYMMAVFLISMSWYFLLKKNMKLCIVFSLLSFYTFYGSFFFIMSILLFLWYKKQYKHFLYLIFYFLFFVSFFSPLLYRQFLHAREQLRLVGNWQEVLGTVNLKNFLLVPIKFTVGRISFYPKPLYYSIAGLWTGFVWFLVIKGGWRNKGLLYFLSAPLVLGLLFSFVTPLLTYFRFLYLVPFMSVLIAFGTQKNWVRGIIVGGFLALSFTYLFNADFHREDWKSLAKYVGQPRYNRGKGKTVYMIYSSSDPIKYYQKNVIVKDLNGLKNTIDPKITIIPYSSDIHGINYQDVLRKRNYRLDFVKSFRGLTVEEWRHD